MKKLVLKKTTPVTEIEMKTAVCNFCGDRNKKCFRGPVPIELSIMVPNTNWERVGIDPEVKLFSLGYRCRDTKFALIQNEYSPWKEEIKKDYSDVCTDCVKQLVKLIK